MLMINAYFWEFKILGYLSVEAMQAIAASAMPSGSNWCCTCSYYYYVEWWSYYYNPIMGDAIIIDGAE